MAVGRAREEPDNDVAASSKRKNANMLTGSSLRNFARAEKAFCTVSRLRLESWGARILTVSLLVGKTPKRPCNVVAEGPWITGMG